MTLHSPTPVVAAAIFDLSHEEPRILCAQRAYPPELKGKWELPGGKVEPNEDFQAALVREIQEELQTHIKLVAPLPNPHDLSVAWPILGGRVMYVWLATTENKPQRQSDHLQLKWCTLIEANELDWLKPNIPIMRAAFTALGKENLP